MPFPFGEETPEIDSKKIRFTFVEVRSTFEKQELLDYLKTKNKKPMSESMRADGRLGMIAIPLSERDDTVGYVGVHVLAEQCYHGAKQYSLKEYLKISKNL